MSNDHVEPLAKIIFDNNTFRIDFFPPEWEQKDLERFRVFLNPHLIEKFLYQLNTKSLQITAEVFLSNFICEQIKKNKLYINRYSGKWNFETDESEWYNNLSEKQLKYRGLI